jgi:alanyl-tRNA synthetase
MIATEIRERFIYYYEKEGFALLPRAPMLHPSIPMSFVMSAGLVQVETSLANAEDRDGDRFVLVQECFRHFDIDRVGTSDTHLSLFEMPGAFVFGPDGKEITIERMWTLATSVLNIDRDRIWVSYFGGGRVLGKSLPPDEETYRAWIKVGAPPNRIVGLGPKHNYWIQGGGIDGMESPRKAGPNTELFYDRGEDLACGPDCNPGCRCGRFVEFSNSLFICYERARGNGHLHPMNEPFAETVIGTERVAMILQNVDSVFAIDSYRPIMSVIEIFINKPEVDETLLTESKRVIADYMRALFILVADGAPPPGKNGRERIIKLLIRGVVTREILLGIQSSEFLNAIIDCLCELEYKNVESSPVVKQRIIKYFVNEAERFLQTIDRGSRQLERLLNKNEGATLSGSQILFLEKRKGLPHLVTARLLREQGLAFAKTDYEITLEDWKRQSHN